ncbi:hypothetical protein CSA57_09720 [candidate division KSB3 bacterium]|nr:MAG: hypothetical protein CSA57_09720 [candidate division KSB3 bacterium]
MALVQISQNALEKRIKRRIRSRTQHFYAVVPPGFEDTACRELAACGISARQEERGGVAFSGQWEDCWKAHHAARIPARILVRLDRFYCTRFEQLEKHVRRFPWELWIRPHHVLAFQVDAQRSALYHEGAVRERLESWVTERLAPWRVISPEPGPEPAMQTVYVRILRNHVTVSLDCSGELLYKRGYEKHVDFAPLRDNIAAAILQEADVSGFDTFVDPMAGSGTFGLETLLLLAKRAAGHYRHFAFEDFPVFRPAAYRHVLKTVFAERRVSARLSSLILCDVRRRSLDIIRYNLKCIAEQGIDTGRVSVKQLDFFQTGAELISGNTLICLNPPYGMRLKSAQSTRNFFVKLGQHLRRYWKGCSFAVIAPGEEAERALALPSSQKMLFHNGGISAAVLIGTLQK